MNLNRSGADLCQKIRDNDRLTGVGHSEQDAVLRYELRTGVFKDLERIKWCSGWKDKWLLQRRVQTFRLGR